MRLNKYRLTGYFNKIVFTKAWRNISYFLYKQPKNTPST